MEYNIIIAPKQAFRKKKRASFRFFAQMKKNIRQSLSK